MDYIANQWFLAKSIHLFVIQMPIVFQFKVRLYILGWPKRPIYVAIQLCRFL